MAEYMIKMISDCKEITKIILGIIYGDERTTIQYRESKRKEMSTHITAYVKLR